MSSKENSSSSAPPKPRKRRNRRPRSPDAAALLFGNPATSGPGSSHPRFQPSSLPLLAPRGHGQGQDQHRVNGGGSGLHQARPSHYHYSPYERLNGNGSSNGGNGGGGGGAPSVAGYGSQMAPAMTDLRGDRRDFVYGPSGGPGSQGLGFPVAHYSSGYGPAPAGPGHPGWHGQRGSAGGGGAGGSQQGAGGSGDPDGDFVVAFGWGRSPYGS